MNKLVEKMGGKWNIEIENTEVMNYRNFKSLMLMEKPHVINSPAIALAGNPLKRSKSIRFNQEGNTKETWTPEMT